MTRYRLVHESGPANVKWSLELTSSLLILTYPDGQNALKVNASEAHPLIDLTMVFLDGTIGIETPSGKQLFKQNNGAAAALKKLVDQGLQSDPNYRDKVRQQSRYFMILGVVLFVLGAVPFAAFIAFVVLEPDLPDDHWISYLGWLIKRILAVFLALILVGFE